MTEVIVIIAILIALFVAPLWGAFALDKRLHRRHPNFKPFVWGYYNALGCFIVPIYGLGAIAGQNPSMEPSSKWQVLCVLLVIFAPLGLLAIKRNRWAFVVLTTLSINPILWLVNGIYLKNRWRELTPNRVEDNDQVEDDTTELLKSTQGPGSAAHNSTSAELIPPIGKPFGESHSSVAVNNSNANENSESSSWRSNVVIFTVISVLLVLSAAIAWFIWPTKWKHDHLVLGDSTYPIRTNRFESPRV